VWCLKADISSYFPSIDHQILKGLFYKRIRCRPTLDLIIHIIDSNGKATGIPIGNLLSQLSANIYLDEFDHYVKESESIAYYVRYMDDFCILHEDKGYLHELAHTIERYLFETRMLRLNPKTSVFPLDQGIDFLGYRTWTDHKLLRRRSVKRMRRKLKVMVQNYRAGLLARAKIDETVKSWVAHAMHADTYRLRKHILGDVVLPGTVMVKAM
jgi:RNA-directed DNA polymerase